MYKFQLRLLSCLFLCAATGIASAQDKIPLKIVLPMPLINANGPTLISGSNLEPPRVSPPRLLVPLGTTNLALRKPVTASSTVTVGNLSMVTDGNKSGYDGEWVELDAGKQWVQIDLGEESEIYAVQVWHFHFKTRIYSNVVVAVSDDPEFKNDVKVIFNNDRENIFGFGRGNDLDYLDTNYGKLIDAKGVKGRYVRLYSNGNNENKMNHYVEVEIFGKME